ncbi:hypothetical protein [Hazenella coriacea]|uniref:Uncharacterized protein n=1 Tax=Hazenella coriacea TaxID=1179467 RepID=A0A4R3L3J0_9BACL|nr:hypothetical protein [Hazenella coriacea]TCS94271.1 hypothetical protein EDD58_104140 [Hazenella coriacea]
MNSLTCSRCDEETNRPWFHNGKLYCPSCYEEVRLEDYQVENEHE